MFISPAHLAQWIFFRMNRLQPFRLCEGEYTHKYFLNPPHMNFKKSALIVLCVVCSDLLSSGHHTHKDYLSHGRSRISSSETDISRDQTWSTVTNGNNPSVTGLLKNGKEHRLKKRVNICFKTWKTWKTEKREWWWSLDNCCPKNPGEKKRRKWKKSWRKQEQGLYSLLSELEVRRFIVYFSHRKS